MPTPATTTISPTGSITGRRLPRRGRLRHPWPAWLALGVAVVLVALAVPRFVAGLLVDRHESVFQKLEQSRDIYAYDRMWSAINGYEAALGWSDDALLYQRLAQLYLAVARDAALDPSRRLLLLSRSIENQRAALARAPADGFAWAQLALALYSTEGATPAFQAAWRRSVALAPYAPALALTRALLGLRAWASLDAESRALVGDQVAVAVAVDGERLVRQMVAQSERRLALSLLARKPEALTRLQGLLSAS